MGRGRRQAVADEVMPTSLRERLLRIIGVVRASTGIFKDSDDLLHRKLECWRDEAAA